MRNWLGTLRGWLTSAEHSGRPNAHRRTAPHGAQRPSGSLIWVHDTHGAFVPHTDALFEYLDDIHGGVSLLWTGPQSNPPSLAQHSTAPPPDTNSNAHGFLNHWSPDIALIFSGEIPVAITHEAHRRGVPTILIQSGADHKPSRSVLRKFTHLFAVGNDATVMLARQGITSERMTVTGALFDGAAPPSGDETERARLAQGLAGRPAWLAANTTAAEDRIVVTAHARAARRAHRLLLILHPSDPARGTDLTESLRREGWRVAQRSEGQFPSEDTQIYVADQADELGLWYRVAPMSFMGGSLDPRSSGGIDPMAAAALGSAILHGPNLGKHASIYARLDSAQAARIVRDAESLTRVLDICNAPEKAAQLAHNAWQVSSAGAEATGMLAEQIVALLDGTEES